MLSICLCIIIRLCESSSLSTKGKRRFYICVLVQRKIAVWVAKKPDIFGLFAGDIFFVSTLWSECRDSNPRPLGPEPSAIPSFATPRTTIAASVLYCFFLHMSRESLQADASFQKNRCSVLIQPLQKSLSIERCSAFPRRNYFIGLHFYANLPKGGGGYSLRLLCFHGFS